MRALRDFLGKLRVSGELIAFLWRRKLWWMMPMVLVLLLLGLLVAFGTATGVGPFVYTLF